jgi:putative inorganic carbon (hco3(-)) transporter
MNVFRRKRCLLTLERWSFYALLAEAFCIAVWPAAAIVCLLAGFAGWLLRMKLDSGVHFRRGPLDIPVLLFAGLGAVSVTVSPDPAFSFYNYYNLVGVYVLTYFLAIQTITKEEQLKQLLLAMAAAALCTVLYGFWQFAFGIDTSAMKWVDGDAFPELKKRIFSTWENPNIFAGYLDEVICMVFAFFVIEKSVRRRFLYGGMILVLAVCLAMTYARGACLSLAVVLLGYGILKDRRVLLGCLGLGAVILLLDPALTERLLSVFTKMDTSSEMRLALWESTIAMILDHPLLGIGWGAYWMVYPEYDFYINDITVRIVHAHNMYLNYAAEIGIPGAVAYLWYFFGTMRLAFLPLRQASSPFLQALRLGIGLALVSVALGGLTDDVLFNIPTSMLLWLLCAMAAVSGRDDILGGDYCERTAGDFKSHH